MIVDGHEDIAFNVLANGRAYLTSAHDIRAAEVGTGVEETAGRAMLGLREWLQAGIGLRAQLRDVRRRVPASAGAAGPVRALGRFV